MRSLSDIPGSSGMSERLLLLKALPNSLGG